MAKFVPDNAYQPEDLTRPICTNAVFSFNMPTNWISQAAFPWIDANLVISLSSMAIQPLAK